MAIIFISTSMYIPIIIIIHKSVLCMYILTLATYHNIPMHQKHIKILNAKNISIIL